MFLFWLFSYLDNLDGVIARSNWEFWYPTGISALFFCAKDDGLAPSHSFNEYYNITIKLSKATYIGGPLNRYYIIHTKLKEVQQCKSQHNELSVSTAGAKYMCLHLFHPASTSPFFSVTLVMCDGYWNHPLLSRMKSAVSPCPMEHLSKIWYHE